MDMIVVRHRGHNGYWFMSNKLVLQLGDGGAGVRDAVSRATGAFNYPELLGVKITINGHQVRVETPLEIKPQTGAAFFNRQRDPDRLSSREWSRIHLRQGGLNVGQFHIKGMRPIEFRIFLYDSTDRLVFTDVDGTITAGDFRGHGANFASNFGDVPVNNHKGVRQFFHAIWQKGYKIIYLTARPITMINYSKRYVFEESSLPTGPFLCSEAQFVSSCFTELAGKIPRIRGLMRRSSLAAMKMTIILSVVKNFNSHFNDNCPEATTSKVVAGAYGNTATDREAYSAAGISGDRIWIISKPTMISGRSVLSPANPAMKTFEHGYQEKLRELHTYYP